MKKYTMQDFIDGKVAVNTGHNWKPLLELCEKHNLRWFSGRRAIEKTSFEYSENIVIECNNYKNGKLTYNDGNHTGAPVTIGIGHFMQMVKGQHRYQITIDCDGDTTTARMIINGKEVKTAKATRNPDDKFNWKMGAQLAFDRLWGEKKDKVKEVKRAAKVGEYIKLIAPEFSFNKKGDILLVTSIAPSGNPNVLEKDHPQKVREAPGDEGWCYDTRCFVVLEGYKPNK